MQGYYCFQAEAYDRDTQRYVDFDGVFRMEVGRSWAEYMEQAASQARSNAAASGLDPATVTSVFISWLIEDEDIGEEE